MSENEIYEAGIKQWLQYNQWKEGEWVVINSPDTAESYAANNEAEIVEYATAIKDSMGGLEFELENYGEHSWDGVNGDTFEGIQEPEECQDVIESYFSSFNIVMKVLRGSVVDLSL